MCVCTQIYMRGMYVCSRQMRKVLDGVERLISHYVEQWMNKAGGRRGKQLEGGRCRVDEGGEGWRGVV